MITRQERHLRRSTPTRRRRASGASRRGPSSAAALRGDVATGTRHSSTLGYDLLYVAVPIASGGTVHGAVRITYPTSELDRRVRNYWLVLAGIARVVLAAAALLGLSFARWIRRPLAGVEEAAAAAGAGRPLGAGPGARRSAGVAPARSRVQRHGRPRRRPRRRAAGVRRGRIPRAAHAADGAAPAPRKSRAACRGRTAAAASPARPPRSTGSRASSTSCWPSPARTPGRRPPSQSTSLLRVERRLDVWRPVAGAVELRLTQEARRRPVPAPTGLPR